MRSGGGGNGGGSIEIHRRRRLDRPHRQLDIDEKTRQRKRTTKRKRAACLPRVRATLSRTRHAASHHHCRPLGDRNRRIPQFINRAASGGGQKKPAQRRKEVGLDFCGGGIILVEGSTATSPQKCSVVGSLIRLALLPAAKRTFFSPI